MEQELIKLGFSSHEAAVYLALIDIGQTGAGEIIKKTGLHRNIIYETLDKLIAKQLALKVTVKNVAQFRSTDPNRIINTIKTSLDMAEATVPELVSRANVKQDIVVYDGLDGFRNYNYSALTRIPNGGTQYILGSVGNLWYELMGEMYQKYRKLRIKKKITWKMIGYAESARDQDVVDMKEFIDLRIIPRNLSTPANMQIWEDVVALQVLTEPYSVIEIKNKALAESYLNYFNLLWEQGKVISE